MEVLKNLWDKLCDEINAQALKTKDGKMKIFILLLNSIPKEIKETILLEYVKACNEIYAIAFL